MWYNRRMHSYFEILVVHIAIKIQREINVSNGKRKTGNMVVLLYISTNNVFFSPRACARGNKAIISVIVIIVVHVDIEI